MSTTHIHDSNFTIDEVKTEPTETAEINVNVTGAQHISNTGIPSKDIKIKLELGDDDDFTNSSLAASFELNSKNTCKICSKSFKTKGYLSTHIIIHTGARSFKCDICSKYFARKQHLSTHMKVHTGERNFKCDICSKCFIRRGDLSTHISIHSGERNYKCDACSKCFTRRSDLTTHMVIHTGERNYKCEVCGKCVARKNDLSSHMKVHTGEKNHKCEICDRVFKRKGNLSTHMKVHGGGNNWRCKICSEWFKSRKNLTKHIKVHIEKRCLFVECKEPHLEENPVQIFTYEEIDTSIKKEKMEIDDDIIDEELSTAAHVAVKIEEKLNLTEIFHAWKKFNSEIIIKEEEIN